VIRGAALLLLLLSFSAVAQTVSQAKYESTFDNDIVSVYKLDLPSRSSVSAFQSGHDSFWLSLTGATVRFSRQQGSVVAEFKPGDARYFPSFETKLLTNIGNTEFRAVMVTLKPRALVSNGCECTGNTGKTICGCKDASHLESLWAFSMGDVTLAGTSLAPDEAFRAAAVRDDMLLIAIGDIELRDEGGSGSEMMPTSMHLKSGDAVWIKGGRHRFRNIGSGTAKFVTLEF
jgi:hypothetical protein